MASLIYSGRPGNEKIKMQSKTVAQKKRPGKDRWRQPGRKAESEREREGVIDVQSGESQEEEVMGEGIGE